jgi:hypothetical protein
MLPLRNDGETHGAKASPSKVIGFVQPLIINGEAHGAKASGRKIIGFFQPLRN